MRKTSDYATEVPVLGEVRRSTGVKEHRLLCPELVELNEQVLDYFIVHLFLGLLTGLGHLGTLFSDLYS